MKTLALTNQGIGNHSHAGSPKNMVRVANELIEEEGSTDSFSGRAILWENRRKVEAIHCSDHLGYEIFKETTAKKYRVAIPESEPVSLFPQNFSNFEETQAFIEDEVQIEFNSLDFPLLDEEDFQGDEQEVLEDMLEEDIKEVHYLHEDEQDYGFGAEEFERDFITFLDMSTDVRGKKEPNLEKSIEVAKTWMSESRE